jgi:hypothetical protein
LPRAAEVPCHPDNVDPGEEVKRWWPGASSSSPGHSIRKEGNVTNQALKAMPAAATLLRMAMIALSLILICVATGLGVWWPLDQEFQRLGLPSSLGNARQFELNLRRYRKLVAAGGVKVSVAFKLFLVSVIFGAVGFALYIWHLLTSAA